MQKKLLEQKGNEMEQELINIYYEALSELELEKTISNRKGKDDHISELNDKLEQCRITNDNMIYNDLSFLC